MTAHTALVVSIHMQLEALLTVSDSSKKGSAASTSSCAGIVAKVGCATEDCADVEQGSAAACTGSEARFGTACPITVEVLHFGSGAQSSLIDQAAMTVGD